MSFQRIKNSALRIMRRQGKLIAIINILGFMGTFLAAAECIESGSDSFSFPVMGIMLFGVMALCGYIIVPVLFKELHNKQYSDVELSLPINAAERYFSKLISLFFIHVLPLIFWQLASYFVNLIILSGNNAALSDNELYARAFFAAILSAALFTDAVAVFCGCCSGTVAESIYFPILTAGCLTLIPMLVINQVLRELAGVLQTYGLEKYICVWTYLPIFYVELFEESWYIAVNIINMVISAAVMFLCIFIYKKRDGESVGFPVTYKSAFELMIFLGVLAVLLMCTSGGMAGLGIFFSLAACVIVRLIVSRAKIKPANILTWLLKYAACYAVYIAISAVVFFTGGFGMANKYVPYIDSDRENTITVYLNVPTDEQSNIAIWTVSSSADHADLKTAMSIIRENTVSGKSLTDFIDVMKNGYSSKPYNYGKNGKALGFGITGQLNEFSYKDYFITEMSIESYEDFENIENELDKLPFLQRHSI